MRKRQPSSLLLLVFLMAALGCLVAFSWLGLAPSRPGVSRENFDRIQMDMTRQQVIGILGRPPDFGPGERKDYLSVYTNALQRLREEGEAWEDGPLVIYVIFMGDRVVGRAFWETKKAKERIATAQSE